jgi:hypothetical protein
MIKEVLPSWAEGSVSAPSIASVAGEPGTGGAAGFGNTSTSAGFGLWPQTFIEGTAICARPGRAAVRGDRRGEPASVYAGHRRPGRGGAGGN